MRGIVKGGLNDKGGGGSFTDEYVNKLLHDNANLTMFADIHSRVDAISDVYYDNFSGVATDTDYSAGHIDDTKTKATSDLLIGETDLSMKVDNTNATTKWFDIGDEVTIQDDTNKECVIVTDNTIVNNEVTHDISTPVTVINSAYTTSANARPQRLSNGWLIVATRNGNTDFRLFKSTDNGLNWVQAKAFGSNYANITLASKGTIVYILATRTTTSNPLFFAYDVLADVLMMGSPDVELDSSQTAYGECSIAINETQTELHAAWSSKNSTYPNSFNIRYRKGTINGDGTVTWGSVEQLTTDNTSTTQNTAPVLIINKLGYSVVIYQLAYSSNKYICRRYFDGSQWTAGGNDTIYNGGSYAQNSPDAIVLSNGEIWVTWYGLDSVNTTKYNVFCSKSVDGGVTWIKPSDGSVGYDRITSRNDYVGGAFPSISYDENSLVYIMFHGFDTIISTSFMQIRKAVFNGSWVVTTVTNNIVDDYLYSSTCNNYHKFTDPLCVFVDEGTSVHFRGVWTEGEATVSLIVTPLQNNYQSGAWIYRSLATNGEFSKDEYVKLSMPMDGIDGSTVITDRIGNTITVNGGSKISTLQSKFGGSSLHIPGNTGDNVKITDSVNVQLENIFTIDFWFLKNGNPPNFCGILDKYTGSTAGWAVDLSSDVNVGKCRFIVEGYSIISTTNICDNVWHHIAVVSDGTKASLYIDGVLEGTLISSTSMVNLANTGHDLFIAGDGVSTLATEMYIDDLRISKGIARWTSNFSVPTTAHAITWLSEDIRYKIIPNPDTGEIVSWITKEKDPGFSIDSKISIVGALANESYGNATMSVYEDLVDTEELQFLYSAPRNSKITQKITLNRIDTSINKKIIKVLGAIGA